MNRLLTILLLLGATAHGQIDNPPTPSSIGLGATNDVTFSQVTVTNTFYPPTFTSTNGLYGAGSLRMTGSTTNTRLVYRLLGVTPADRTVLNAEDNLINLSSASVARTNLGLGATWLTNTDVTNFRTAIGLGATNNVTFNELTATGNVTLNGSDNLMPNATNAASASSLMTRGLADLRLFAQLALLDQIRSDMGTVHATNGGGGAIDVNGFDLTTSTNSASSSLYRGYFGSKQTLSGTGGNTVWQGRVVAAWAFNRFNTNVEVRMQFGRNQSVTNHGPLNERGMGIRVNGNNMFFETHDGTTHFETTNAVALTHNFGPDVFWAVSESGVARFYRGESTLLATVTNNVPTTFSADAQRWVISISNTSTVSSGFRVRSNPGYILQQ